MNEPSPLDASAVLAAAERRGRALTDRDEGALRELLHPLFAWSSYRGESFDHDGYLAANLDALRWRAQSLDDARVDVVGDTAVLRCMVTDVVERHGDELTFRMPMTQTWVRQDGAWRLLAGHVGPRLE